MGEFLAMGKGAEAGLLWMSTDKELRHGTEVIWGGLHRWRWRRAGQRAVASFGFQFQTQVLVQRPFRGNRKGMP